MSSASASPSARPRPPGLKAAKKSARLFCGTEAGEAAVVDSGLWALAAVAGYYRIAADPAQISHDLGLRGCCSGTEDVVRAARRIGLKAKLLRSQCIEQLASVPFPAIVPVSGSAFLILTRRLSDGRFASVD